MIQPGPRSKTLPLFGALTRRLGATRRLRTLPFTLEDAGPHPAGFSARRFSPESAIMRLGGVELEIIDRPAETLGEAASLALIEIHRLTAEHTPYHAGTYMHRHLEQATTLIVIRKDGQVAGVSLATAIAAEGRRFLFINASMYAPAIRGGQLAARVNLVHIWRSAWRQFPRSVFVAFRTQNPLVLSTAVSSAPFHPRPDSPVPARIKAAAAALSRALNPESDFDGDALVQRGILARDAIDPAPPRHRDEAINAFCDRHLDYEAGDLFLAVAEMSLPVIARMAWINWRKAMARRRR